METVAVIDFETTGLSPDQGARATEIAAVIVRNGQLVDHYQSLMNAGVRIPPFIEAFTGISNAMIRCAPPAAEVMGQVAKFIGHYPLIAHHAAFDRKFLDAELARIGQNRRQEFACSMLIARRLYPNARDHKLGTLVQYAHLPVTGRYHRALADAEMTAHLLVHMQAELQKRYCLSEIPHPLLRLIQKASRGQLDACMERYRKEHECTNELTY